MVRFFLNKIFLFLRFRSGGKAFLSKKPKYLAFMNRKWLFFGVCALLYVLPVFAQGACGPGSSNCCGNNVCEAPIGEDFGTCQIDCQTPKEVTVSIRSPVPGSIFARGESVVVQATVRADSVLLATPGQIFVVGKFGSLDLFDDGAHDDEAAGDKIYGNRFEVTEEYLQQAYTLAVTATVSQTTNTSAVPFEVQPFLAINFSTDKEAYALGEEMVVSGIVSRRQTGVAMDLNIELVAEDAVLYSKVVQSSSDGRFEFSYQSTTLDPAGEWLVKLSARDESGNSGFYQKKIVTALSSPFSSLTIRYLSQSNDTVKTGEFLIVEAEVLDAGNNRVSGAEVLLVPPGSRDAVMVPETPAHTYSVLYKVPFDLELGQQQFELRAKKNLDASVETASLLFVLRIARSPLLLVLFEPVQSQFEVGDLLPIAVRVAYSDNRPLEGGFVSARVNGEEVALSPVDRGLFAGDYFVREKDLGKVVLELNARDAFGNAGESSLEVFVHGYSWSFLIAQNALLAGIAFVVILGGGIWLARRLRLGKAKKSLVSQEAVLRGMLQDLQKRYYQDKVISRENYDAERVDLESQLEKVKAQLEKLGEKKKR